MIFLQKSLSPCVCVKKSGVLCAYLFEINLSKLFTENNLASGMAFKVDLFSPIFVLLKCLYKQMVRKIINDDVEISPRKSHADSENTNKSILVLFQINCKYSTEM